MADKEKALETALQQIEKKYGKGAIMRLGSTASLNIESISTGSISLDNATGIGGLPKGRIVEIYGPESSGKTTLALHVVAPAEKPRSLTRSMLLTPFMLLISELTLTLCSFHSPTTANRLSKLPRLSRVPARSTLLLSTPSPLLFPKPKSRAIWATAT